MPEHLLVVDDNEMNRDMLSRRLIRAGYQVSVAEGGQQALSLLFDHQFDLVLLDVLMPGIDGMAVLGIIRRTYSMTELPVIMVTAKDASEDIIVALEQGANDYINKPINFPVAHARIQTQLTARKASKEVRQLATELETRNRFIRKIFGRYVSDEVVDSLLSAPEGLDFGGVHRDVTILIADLRGFTLLADTLPPESIVTLLNNFLGTMIDIIGKYHGTVAEIVGDGILAFFGAPVEDDRHALNAVACAIEMQNTMKLVNETSCGMDLPELHMGIGINSGEGVVGNIGSEIRSKYAVVGSVVNIASRIESCSTGGQVMISGSTLKEVGTIVKIESQQTIRPKGLRHAIDVFDVSGISDKYNLFLDKRDTALSELDKNIELHCTLLKGKQVSGEGFAARLVRLSCQSAQIQTPHSLDVYDDLHIRLGGSDGHLYGKIQEKLETENHFVVQFTSLSPEIRAVIKQLLQPGPTGVAD